MKVEEIKLQLDNEKIDAARKEAAERFDRAREATETPTRPPVPAAGVRIR